MADHDTPQGILIHGDDGHKYFIPFSEMGAYRVEESEADDAPALGKKLAQATAEASSGVVEVRGIAMVKGIAMASGDPADDVR